MKHWVIGDIHGQYFALRAILNHMDLENDDITFLGDYIDWGKYSIKTLQFLMTLTKKYPNIKCLIGNHDSLMINTVKSKIKKKLTELEVTTWGQNGGRKTLKQFNKLDIETQREIIGWLEGLEYTRELDVRGHKFYLAHAYPKKGNNKKDIIWRRVNPGENPFDNMGEYYENHTLICGHTISNRFTHGSFEVFFDNKFIILDCGAKVLNKYPKKARVAAICLDNMQPVYVDCIEADNWRWNNLKDWN